MNEVALVMSEDQNYKAYLLFYVFCRQKYQLIIVLLSVTVGLESLQHQDLSDS